MQAIRSAVLADLGTPTRLRQPRACASRRLEPIWIGRLDITDNTIVIFISDNGAETFSWPDGGNHRFRGE